MEQMDCSVPTSCSPEVGVLREFNSFLKEQLEAKDRWHLTQLDTQVQRTKELVETLGEKQTLI